VQMYHSEAAPGQYEVITGPLPPLQAVDALIHTRMTIFNVASKHGLRATLAPRVFMDSCMPIPLLLLDTDLTLAGVHFRWKCGPRTYLCSLNEQKHSLIGPYQSIEGRICLPCGPPAEPSWYHSARPPNHCLLRTYGGRSLVGRDIRLLGHR